MGGGDYFYEGANYGFDPEYGGTSQAYSASSGIGLTTDPRTANQLKVASEKLNTGAKAVEISAVSPDVFESIPKEHFKELNRLRKLMGNNVELTLHAPIVEPTGLTRRGWDEFERVQAERQMFDAVSKAHSLNPEGNVVTTFHASAAGIPGELKVWEEKEVEGVKKKVPVVKEAYVIDERTGSLSALPMKPSYFEGGAEIIPQEEIKKLNNSNWYKNLQHLNYSAEHGASIIEATRLQGPQEKKEQIENANKDFARIYKDYAQGKTEEADAKMNEMIKKYPEIEKIKDISANKMQAMLHGDLYLRDAYANLRELYDQAYAALKREGKTKEVDKLDAFKKEIQPFVKDQKYLNDPEHITEFAEKIRKGVHVLRSIETPQIYKPLKEFAMEKSSETFGDVAFQSFQKFGEKSPIISIENPPAGQGIIYTGEDLRELIDKSREKFAKLAVEKKGMTAHQAKKEAEKIIGATWDVGHINMLRKFGAGEKELIETTKKIAPAVKHVHLSDNFGLEHTELPMGMGNVPMQGMLKEIEDKTKKFRKIIEAGNWYQHFQSTPFAETLEHFNSPIYAMKNASYWGSQGGYFSGYGMNPDIHHAMYGAGFSNLPVELGGQMSGRSRVSGSPMD